MGPGGSREGSIGSGWRAAGADASDTSAALVRACGIASPRTAAARQPATGCASPKEVGRGPGRSGCASTAAAGSDRCLVFTKPPGDRPIQLQPATDSETRAAGITMMLAGAPGNAGTAAAGANCHIPLRGPRVLLSSADSRSGIRWKRTRLEGVLDGTSPPRPRNAPADWAVKGPTRWSSIWERTSP